MFAKVYGKGKNYEKQNYVVVRERTLREKSHIPKKTSSGCLVLYGKPRKRDRPHERDSLFWGKGLDEASKGRLKMARQLDRLNDDKLLDDQKLDDMDTTILKVLSQDLHVTENGIAHHTDEFDCVEEGQAVVRRGQEFKLTLTFQRPWVGETDDMFLIFKLGESPKKSNGTHVKVKLEEGNATRYKDARKKQWGARIDNQDGNSLTLAVYSPPDAIIGEWEYAIQTVKTGGPKKKIYQCIGEDDIIILLNPWCHDDQVFMKEQDKLAEYVENEFGMVFYGTHSSIGAKSWFYGQFQESILEVSLHLLRKAFDYDITKKMSSPVQISRGLSRILNDCDDMGVLSGNWSGNYTGGTPPLSWKGSVPILQEYYADKQPVKFGQCWVFSHVLTTVSRALGLPCRSVTNFASAHDTNLSLTIDKFVDADGDMLKSADSIWNFHVWNEVWMNRPDLDKLLKEEGKYDGWHAIDATPQEVSEYLFQCGPSPVAAIRNGEMHVGYDTKFIFAEVNADVCTWRDDGDDPQLVSQATNSVGKCISTKVPNGEAMSDSWFGFDEDDRLDLTDHYKHPEGSVAEREAMQQALSDGDMAEHLFSNPTGVSVVILPLTAPKVGEDFAVEFSAQNKTSEPRNVKVRAIARPMTYWGDVIGTRKIADQSFKEVTLEPNETKTFELSLEADRYLAECDQQLALSMLASATVKGFDDHENRIYTSEDIQVQGPRLMVKGPKRPVSANDVITVDLEFTNPLNRDLDNCYLSVEGSVKVEESGFDKKHSVYKKKIENIKAKETRHIKVKVRPNARPKKSKKREIEFGINCDQLPEIEGRLALKLE